VIAGVESKGWLEQLSKVVEERGVTEFVVGYPLHMNGEVGVRAREVDSFAERLREKFALPVSKVDERLTSLAAEEALGKKANPKDGKIDATAASLILKDFLDGGKLIE
jgi:putative Holliday junction resolvase